MGTKLNPGRFDCYANAKPDEPMFILLARDPQAPTLVRLWAASRVTAEGCTDKVEEALRLADAMDDWKKNYLG